MNKKHIIILASLVSCLSLYGMRSARIADRYTATTRSAHKTWCACLCPWRRAPQAPLDDHYFCEQPICEPLMSGLNTCNLVMVTAHLTPDNVNAKIIVPDRLNIAETHELTILGYVLHRYPWYATEFKIQLINLLVSLGFDGNILTALIADGEIDLIEQFIQTPAAHHPKECSKNTPWVLYTAQRDRWCTRAVARRIAAAYVHSSLTPLTLKSRFAIIARLLSYPSLKEVVRYQNVALLEEIHREYPCILQEPVTLTSSGIEVRSTSILDFSEKLFDSGYIGSETFAFLADWLEYKTAPLPGSDDSQEGPDAPISKRHCTSVSRSGISIQVTPPPH